MYPTGHHHQVQIPHLLSIPSPISPPPSLLLFFLELWLLTLTLPSAIRPLDGVILEPILTGSPLLSPALQPYMTNSARKHVELEFPQSGQLFPEKMENSSSTVPWDREEDAPAAMNCQGVCRDESQKESKSLLSTLLLWRKKDTFDFGNVSVRRTKAFLVPLKTVRALFGKASF